MAIDILDAFENEPEPLDFVIPGFLAGTVGALIAPGATGKSFLALEAVMSVACSVAGGDLLDLKPENTGPAVYLAAEDPEIVVRRRLHAIGRHLPPAARDAIAERVLIEPLLGTGFNIMDEKHLNRAIAWSEGARLVVIDTLSRIHRLDENCNGDMAQVFAALERLAALSGAAVLFLHHTSKSASFGNQTDHQHASRGASVLTDNARFAAALVRMSETEASDYGVDEAVRRNFVRLVVPKNNYGEDLGERWYRRSDGGVLIPARLEQQRQGKTKAPVAPAKPEGNSRDIW